MNPEPENRPVLRASKLRSPLDQPARGWRGKLQRFIRGTDVVLVSLGEVHRFVVAESLAILMIFHELREVTKSVA